MNEHENEMRVGQAWKTVHVYKLHSSQEMKKRRRRRVKSCWHMTA